MFEYIVRGTEGYKEAEDEMNIMSSNGWEPVHCTETNRAFVVVYKRPKLDKEEFVSVTGG